MTIGRSRSLPVVLINLSTTGARMRGDELPELDDDLFLRINSIEAFATVVWKRNGMCGVSFDEPLTPLAVELARRDASVATMTHLTPEERQALDDWRGGMAR